VRYAHFNFFCSILHRKSVEKFGWGGGLVVQTEKGGGRGGRGEDGGGERGVTMRKLGGHNCRHFSPNNGVVG